MATFVGYGIDTLLTMAWQELTGPETMGDEPLGGGRDDGG